MKKLDDDIIASKVLDIPKTFLDKIFYGEIRIMKVLLKKYSLKVLNIHHQPLLYLHSGNSTNVTVLRNA